MSESTRRSTRTASTNSKAVPEDDEKKAETDDAPKPSKTRKAASKKKKSASKTTTAKKKRASPKAASSDDDSSTDEKKPKKRRSKAPPHQRITERDPLPKLWNPEDASEGSYTFKIASWNVAGIRALLRNTPTALSDLVSTYDLDVLCLQETKLQESHLDDPKLNLNGGDLIDGYDAYWSCSTARKGYAGTAVFIKQRGGGASNKKQKQTSMSSFLKAPNKTSTEKSSTAKEELDADMIVNLTPTEVSYKMGIDEHDSEGRIITLDFPLFSFSNVYVPNSGQKLDRLSYRTDQWDKDLLNFIQSKQSDRGVPAMWLGDLNVAHTNLEVWNDGAKHLPKQAGVTPEERASFQAQLDSGFFDAFRKLHPEAKGHYSYWSQRAGNREPNKGLRLDYFVCPPSLFDDNEKVVVRDSYMIPETKGSDHCPVVLELEIKK